MKKTTAISKIKENSTGMAVLMAIVGLLCLGSVILGVGDSVYHSTFSEKKEEMAQLLGTGTVFAACAFITSYIFRGISRTGIPFSEEAVKGVKTIAGLLFAGAFLPNILLTVFSGKYATVSGSFIQISILIPAILIFCLAEFLGYGAMLQKESDETV
ncbi:MAG: DUF2975 domain-containing protein [Ruminococcus sp.]|nr:DUF2975 domain-containing protein [Ruminococcus sp.]